MSEYNRRGLSDLSRICVFKEEGILRVMPAKPAQYPTDEKNAKATKYGSLLAASTQVYMRKHLPKYTVKQSLIIRLALGLKN